jgi:hypothetical protein
MSFAQRLTAIETSLGNFKTFMIVLGVPLFFLFLDKIIFWALRVKRNGGEKHG